MNWKKVFPKIHIVFYVFASLVVASVVIVALIAVLVYLSQNISPRIATFISEREALFDQISWLEKEKQSLEEAVLRYQEQEALWKTEKEIFQFEGTKAKILGFALGSNRSVMFIDNGTKKGIAAGDWVIVGQKTLLGRIKKVFPNYAVVQTIFDPHLKITAVIMPQNIHGLFSFEAKNFTLDFIPEKIEIEPGSLVETSGQDGVFPKGFLLGKIDRIQDSSQIPFQKAIIEPAFNINTLMQVAIIKNIFTAAE